MVKFKPVETESFSTSSILFEEDLVMKNHLNFRFKGLMKVQN